MKNFLFNALFSRLLAPLYFHADDSGGGGGGQTGQAGAGTGGAAGVAAGTQAAGAGTIVAGAGAQAAGAAGNNAAAGTAGGAVATGPLIGADGKFVTGWSKLVGGTDALEQKFTDPKALVGSYLSLEKMISAKGIIPPGPNATAEEKSAFFKALGRPDKPEDYGLKMPEKIGDKAFPKELWNAEQAAGFAKVAHGLGLTAQQTQALVEFDAARGLSAHEGSAAAQQQAQATAQQALKDEWKGEYAANLALAKKAAIEVGGDELLADPLANSPAFIKAMAAVGKLISEDGAAGARGTQRGQGAASPAAEIQAIMNDAKHPWQANYKDHGHSKAAHEAAVAAMQRLYQQKNGEVAA